MTLDTHPRLRHPTLGRPHSGRAPQPSGRTGQRLCAQRQDQRAEQREVRSHGDSEDPGCGRGFAVAPTFKWLAAPSRPSRGPPRREGLVARGGGGDLSWISETSGFPHRPEWVRSPLGP